MKQLMRKKRRFHEIHHKLLSDVSIGENVPVVSEEEDNESSPTPPSSSSSSSLVKNNIDHVKSLLLQTLISSNGDVSTPQFQSYSNLLSEHNTTTRQTSGNWVSLSKPNYPECLGMNDNGEFMYTLGRMSFDMFLPSNLKCSIHGIFNVFGDEEEEMTIPWNIRNAKHIKSYNISVSFSIETGKTTLKALLTNHGYIAPDPHTPNRYSIWFTHGILEEDSSETTPEWMETFSTLPQRSIKEKARILAAKILLGATIPEGLGEDGRMEYKFKRPIGGWNDVLFGDESLMILRGQHGSMYVLHRI